GRGRAAGSAASAGSQFGDMDREPRAMARRGAFPRPDRALHRARRMRRDRPAALRRYTALRSPQLRWRVAAEHTLRRRPDRGPLQFFPHAGFGTMEPERPRIPARALPGVPAWT